MLFKEINGAFKGKGDGLQHQPTQRLHRSHILQCGLFEVDNIGPLVWSGEGVVLLSFCLFLEDNGLVFTKRRDFFEVVGCKFERVLFNEPPVVFVETTFEFFFVWEGVESCILFHEAGEEIGGNVVVGDIGKSNGGVCFNQNSSNSFLFFIASEETSQVNHRDVVGHFFFGFFFLFFFVFFVFL